MATNAVCIYIYINNCEGFKWTASRPRSDTDAEGRVDRGRRFNGALCDSDRRREKGRIWWVPAWVSRTDGLTGGPSMHLDPGR